MIIVVNMFIKLYLNMFIPYSALACVYSTLYTVTAAIAL
jgi:hypothetical protein